MKPETRASRTTSTPGVVDLPRSRRPASQVTVENSKKKELAASKAQKKREREEQVAMVEREIKTAQKEAAQPLSRGSRVKKTFPRQVSMSYAAEEVKLIN